MRDAKAQAEVAALERSALLAAAARRLRQSLNIIMHDMQQVAPGASGDQEALTQAQRAAGRLATALDQLTELAQFDSGKRHPQRRYFQSRSCSIDVANAWSSPAHGKRLVFEPPRSLETVYSDPGLLGMHCTTWLTMRSEAPSGAACGSNAAVRTGA